MDYSFIQLQAITRLFTFNRVNISIKDVRKGINEDSLLIPFTKDEIDREIIKNNEAGLYN